MKFNNLGGKIVKLICSLVMATMLFTETALADQFIGKYKAGKEDGPNAYMEIYKSHGNVEANGLAIEFMYSITYVPNGDGTFKALDKEDYPNPYYSLDYYFVDKNGNVPQDGSGYSMIVYKFKVKEDGSWDIYEDNSAGLEKVTRGSERDKEITKINLVNLAEYYKNSGIEFDEFFIEELKKYDLQGLIPNNQQQTPPTKNTTPTNKPTITPTKKSNTKPTKPSQPTPTPKPITKPVQEENKKPELVITESRGKSVKTCGMGIEFKLGESTEYGRMVIVRHKRGINRLKQAAVGISSSIDEPKEWYNDLGIEESETLVPNDSKYIHFVLIDSFDNYIQGYYGPVKNEYSKSEVKPTPTPVPTISPSPTKAPEPESQSEDKHLESENYAKSKYKIKASNGSGKIERIGDNEPGEILSFIKKIIRNIKYWFDHYLHSYAYIF